MVSVEPNRVHRVREILGLPISIDVRDVRSDAPALINRAFDWLGEVQARFSPSDPDSEVCRMNRSELPRGGPSPELSAVLGLCATYTARSGGAFCARTEDHALDPSGLVIGWGVQRAADLLRQAGIRNFQITAGGDVITAGEPAPGQPWRVGVRDPERADRMCVTLGVRDAAVATLSAHDRGAHMMDGRTGRTPEGLLSITVLAPDLTTADGTAAAGYALGKAGIGWAAGQRNCQVYAVTTEHRVLRSAGLDQLILR